MNTVNHSVITVNNIEVHIDRKDIKNLHVGVYPPYGRVRIAAPLHIDDEAVRLAVISKLSWIKKQKDSFENQPRQSKREMVSGESHYFFGKRYLLNVIIGSSKHKIVKNHSKLELHVRANTSIENRQKVLNDWYREELKKEISKLIPKCEKLVNIKVNSWEIKKMKTKWGSCNIENKKILLNLELAKKSIENIEYIVVHELVHLMERHHNDNFKKLMDKFMPNWRERRDELNSGVLENY
ncbi:SprT family zinc-dependent metalloprotease [Sulfurimonas sp.]|uniref:M48 family metallopeptidase n=1 Tax=Sulfurimonas sp. TaxID=2022749 RepID=UPI0025CF9CCF|nr:SprT family zinc-dependent metalloprotease [Sulfurimonas sp.]